MVVLPVSGYTAKEAPVNHAGLRHAAVNHGGSPAAKAGAVDTSFPVAVTFAFIKQIHSLKNKVYST